MTTSGIPDEINGKGTNQIPTSGVGASGTEENPSMNHGELLGRVAALYLWSRLSLRGSGEVVSIDDTMNTEDSEDTARFIIDCLTATQTASIAHAILADAELSKYFDIKLPATLMAGFDLPASVLTQERATYFRSAQCPKPALLLANTGDDEQQSLQDVSPIGASDLQSEAELWVQVASTGLLVTEDEQKWWAQALRGLHDLRLTSLDRFADYVLRTRSLIKIEGLPVCDALDAALPALRLPKRAGEFSRLAPRIRGQVAKWRSQYSTVYGKRACFLSKQTPSGVVLSEDELRVAFDRVKDDIPIEYHAIINEFINAPGGWTQASSLLAECDWEDIKPLFDGLKREKFNLGQATLDFYGERNPELLIQSEREYLSRLSLRRTTEAALDDDRVFYDAHRDELREDRKLKSAWDRFVFGAPEETNDFLVGLIACLESFSWETPSKRRSLTISCESRYRREFRDLNIEAGIYFAQRYQGLEHLFNRDVVWNVGELFKFPDLVDSWRQRGQQLNHSEAKAALQLKFVVTLEVETINNSTERTAAQFVWRYNPEWIASEFVNDWARLAAHPFLSCRAERETTSSKGAAQSVDLWNVRTLMAVYSQDRGSLVGIYRPENDLAQVWRANLHHVKERGLLNQAVEQRLLTIFDSFVKDYTGAVRGFTKEGLSSLEIGRQLTSYSELLKILCLEAKGDRTRQLLLRPLMQLGTVAVLGGRPTAIVAPWHPLRMAAMVRKAHRVANLVHHLITTPQIEFGDPRLFFRELREELGHPHYPEVALGWQGDQPELLSLTDSAGDYTLHESPIAADAGADDTNENPAEGATQVVDLVHRYLALHPHEQANLSVVLYNCDSSRLPLAVVDKLGAMHQDEEDVRCQVVLRHRDSQRLARLYEQIVDASDGDSDAFVASETTRDFMARLRIGISANQAPPPDPRDGCPEDLVFSQDVIARHAKLEWYLINARPANPEELNPAQWSRRRPVATGDMKSVVYLCCPVQREEGWAYLTSIASFFKGDWDGNNEQRLIPARQLDFNDVTTSRIFEETHNLATWVVNYDELLDRRQLVEQGVRIIRYKQITTQGRNLIVSSRAPMGLLRSMVVSRLRDLNLGIGDSDLYSLAERFINQANDVSGDIVLRAAQRGKSASEMMGLVLSRYLVHHELGLNNLVGWFFLDDYADWLGQHEENIADLLALCPKVMPDGSMRLVVVVTEAKYIDATNLAEKRKESQKQLRDTLRRIAGATLQTQARMDRDIWLARLSDLLVDGIPFPTTNSIDLQAWSRAVRDGQCAIELRGYSHVFISGPADSSESTTRIPLAETVGLPFRAHQEVYGRDRVRDLVKCYCNLDDPTSLRGYDLEGDLVVTLGIPQQGPGSIPLKEDHEVNIKGSSATVPPDAGIAFPTPQTTNADARVPAQNQTGEIVNGSWSYQGIANWVQGAPTYASESSEDLAWLQQVEATSKLALHQFQLQAKLLRSMLTPNAALLKFQGSANLTIDQVQRRRLEFLTTYGLDLIGVQPEPGIVSLSIARPTRRIISLRTLWNQWTFDSHNGNRTLLIGVREDDGKLLVLSPGEANGPHTLIAGSTGSGKSVLMQNIILCIAATNNPHQARITLVDPKQGVDYFALEDLPHLDGGVIDKQEEALSKIRALVEEMDARYVRMRQAKAANLSIYNERVSPAEQMPTLWLIHDEFAEWMLTEDYKQEVASAVQRLGVKARAAGIHLVFAAQRPEVNVMPMQLRANLGNRLVLRVDSEGTSELALGEKGAEHLLGKGHLLAKLEGVPLAIYAQVPFATPGEIDELVQLIRSAAQQS